LLRDPVGVLQKEYFGSQGLGDQDAVSAAAQRLFPLVAALLNTVGAGAIVPDPTKITTAQWGDPGASLATSSMYLYVRPADDIEVGAMITLSAADAGDLGFVLSPVGSLTFDTELAGWSVALTAQGAVNTIAIGKAGAMVVD